ncbi:MAG: hypothetical protein U9Q77_04225 [Candidatus Marinimicrobia bacterium]|nr:hypothetical protein [Candidatus Neomarinimicrobiota bacterium]
MFSISETAKTRLSEAKKELKGHAGMVVRLDASTDHKGAFKLYIDTIHPGDYKIYGDDEEPILVLEETLLPKLAKTGLEYDEQFSFVHVSD